MGTRMYVLDNIQSCIIVDADIYAIKDWWHGYSHDVGIDKSILSAISEAPMP